VPARYVELECAIEECPSVHFFWAHLAVHIHDELLLAMQVHAPLIDDLNPLPILRWGSHVLDDNVNMTWHALDLCSTENLAACSKRVTTLRWHLVIVFLPSINMDTSLACQIVVASRSASRKRAIKLKMFSAVCRLNIKMVTKCRLDMMPPTQMQMRMSKNELLWCVLPSSVTKNAKINGCNNRSVILFRLVATKAQTYWPTLWLLMLPSFCTLKWSLVW
jgi:hypothetical protein